MTVSHVPQAAELLGMLSPNKNRAIELAAKSLAHPESDSDEVSTPASILRALTYNIHLCHQFRSSMARNKRRYAP